MSLNFIQLELIWPLDVALADLRPWLLPQLNHYGEPLRWAITSIETLESPSQVRKLHIEAVVISPELYGGS